MCREGDDNRKAGTGKGQLVWSVSLDKMPAPFLLHLKRTGGAQGPRKGGWKRFRTVAYHHRPKDVKLGPDVLMQCSKRRNLQLVHRFVRAPQSLAFMHSFLCLSFSKRVGMCVCVCLNGVVRFCLTFNSTLFADTLLRFSSRRHLEGATQNRNVSEEGGNNSTKTVNSTNISWSKEHTHKDIFTENSRQMVIK